MTVPLPPAVVPPLVEPGPALPVEETASQVARADRDYWVDRDYGDEPDDPSDHYYC